MGLMSFMIDRVRADENITNGSESDDEVLMVPQRHVTANLFKDYDLYLATKNGDLNQFRSSLDRVSATELLSSVQILSRMSPSGNTFLHLAVVHGHEDIVSYIAAKDSSLVLLKNFNGDTPLHLAVKTGNESIVKALVVIHSHNLQSQAGIENEEDKDNLLRVKNEIGNTVLHEALINGRESIVHYLIKEDPILVYYGNKEGKYGLYLAIEGGFADCVSSILECLTDYERTNDQFKEKSPIKAAIVNKRQDMLEVILDSSSHLMELQDGQGRMAVHYAALSGHVEVINYLLKRHAFGAAQRDEKGAFPIHLASIGGHVDAIRLLLNNCPIDPVELIDNNGQNILHVAVKNGKLNVVHYILRDPKLKELINMGDQSGNTPLHLASKYFNPEIVTTLTWDKRVDVKLINNEAQTALDVAEVHMKHNFQFRQRLTWAALKAAGTPRKKARTKDWENHVENYKERVDTLLLVSTLVATITFAAGFTLPGGYNTSEEDPGMAIMLSFTGFHVFLLCDTIAMFISLFVTATLLWAQLGDLRLVLNALNITQPLLGIAIFMMSIAFTAGIFIVVRNLHWLSVVILAMGLVVLVVLLVILIPLCVPVTSTNKILRYISYYPFWLLILATGSQPGDEDIRFTNPLAVLRVALKGSRHRSPMEVIQSDEGIASRARDYAYA